MSWIETKGNPSDSKGQRLSKVKGCSHQNLIKRTIYRGPEEGKGQPISRDKRHRTRTASTLTTCSRETGHQPGGQATTAASSAQDRDATHNRRPQQEPDNRVATRKGFIKGPERPHQSAAHGDKGRLT